MQPAATRAPAAGRAPAALRVDFILDIACPWCAIGLAALEQAIAQIAGEAVVELHLQPFELNPDVGPDGEPIAAYAARKHGAGPAQLAERQALILGRAAGMGLAFRVRTHVYNTFDALRLLHWSAGSGRRQLALGRALLQACHERGENPSSPDVLLAAASDAGLDRIAAGDMLGRGAHAAQARAVMRQWRRLGIGGVPATLIGGRRIVPGAQSPGVFAQALREAAAEAQANRSSASAIAAGTA